MSRFCFVLAVLIFVLNSVFAQNTVEWKLYEPSNEAFSVELPATVSVSRDTSGGKDSSILYSAATNKMFIYITSGKENKISVLGDIRNLIKSEKAAEENIPLDEFTVNKYSFTDSEDFFQTIVLAKGKKHFYIFHAVSAEKDSSDIERFFSSIKLNNQIIEMPKTQAPAQKPEETVRYGMSTGKDSGQGIGIGSGSVSGTGSEDSTTIRKPNPDNQISQLKFLYLPKPSYTDLARYYWMQGKVALRVTFLANGTIGNITSVTKLPFGLTNSAINAARQIRFEPATRNGVPVTMLRPVEFRFTIY